MSAGMVVREMGTGAVVHVVDVSGRTESQVDRIEMGMLAQMDRERFTVGLEDPAPPVPEPDGED